MMRMRPWTSASPISKTTIDQNQSRWILSLAINESIGPRAFLSSHSNATPDRHPRMHLAFVQLPGRKTVWFFGLNCCQLSLFLDYVWSVMLFCTSIENIRYAYIDISPSGMMSVKSMIKRLKYTLCFMLFKSSRCNPDIHHYSSPYAHIRDPQGCKDRTAR